ncbi:MAG: hypothetical protein U0X20_00590 [Caldilineaceae bacterium]
MNSTGSIRAGQPGGSPQSDGQAEDKTAELQRQQQEIVDNRKTAYDARQEAAALSRLVYEHGRSDKLSALLDAQQRARGADKRAAAAEAKRNALIADTAGKTGQQSGSSTVVTRSLSTTGVEIKVTPRMKYVPTAFYHLLEPETDPLVECRVTTSKGYCRVRVTAYIEGYSSQAVQSEELRRGEVKQIALLPTLYPDRARTLTELTRGMLNVLAEDLDTQKVEVHTAIPIWLLARNAATFEVDDPGGGKEPIVRDFRHFLGAFVTPNHPRIQRFLRDAADRHPDHRLVGGLESPAGQAEAIYTALQEDANITYVNSSLAFNPRAGAIGQRVRLPHECLEERQANCLDGVLLFASLLEALSIETTIVLVPEHVMVGWRTGKEAEDWQYVETTLLRTSKFAEAVQAAGDWVEFYRGEQEKEGAAPGEYFRRLELRNLRSKYGVTPLV